MGRHDGSAEGCDGIDIVLGGQPAYHVTGDMSGHGVPRLRLHDLIIHTWHAAQVLQAAPFQIRPELLSWAFADLASDTFAVRHFRLDWPAAGGVPRDQETLLAAFGRRCP